MKHSDRLTPRQRVDLYGGMYFHRLLDLMDEEFPTVKHLLGDEQWVQDTVAAASVFLHFCKADAGTRAALLE